MAINVTREEFETLERRLRRNTPRYYEDLRATGQYIEQSGDEYITHPNPTIMVPFKDLSEIPMGTIFMFKSITNTPLGSSSGDFTILFPDPTYEDMVIGVPFNTTYIGELRSGRFYALTLTTGNNVRVVEFHDGALADDVNTLLQHKADITDRFTMKGTRLTVTGGNGEFAASQLFADIATINNNLSVMNTLTAERITLPAGGYDRFKVGTDESGIVTNDILTNAVNDAVVEALEDKIRIDARTPLQYEQDTEEILPDGVLYFQVNTVLE